MHRMVSFERYCRSWPGGIWYSGKVFFKKCMLLGRSPEGLLFNSILISLGDRGRGWAKGLTSPQRGLRGHSWVLVGAATPLPSGMLNKIAKCRQKDWWFPFPLSDPQFHIGWEKFDHNFPPAYRLHQTFPQRVAERGENGLKCSRHSTNFQTLKKDNFMNYLWKQHRVSACVLTGALAHKWPAFRLCLRAGAPFVRFVNDWRRRFYYIY